MHTYIQSKKRFFMHRYNIFCEILIYFEFQCHLISKNIRLQVYLIEVDTVACRGYWMPGASVRFDAPLQTLCFLSSLNK